MQSDNNIFWLNNPSVLIRDGNYMKFFPDTTMTRIQQLNSMTLFCVYAIIILYIMGRSESWIQIPILGIVLIIILYYFFDTDNVGKMKELFRLKGSEEKQEEKTLAVESGYYDADGKLHLGENNPSHKRKKEGKINYTYDDMETYKKGTCRRPTADNPLMNPLQVDFNNGEVPVACNSNEEDISNEISKTFDDGLFKDVDDLFDVRNSQRQFYTVPVLGIPNDQDAYAKWLYKTPTTCKEDQVACLRYEDLKFNR